MKSSPPSFRRVRELLLDAVGCAAEGRRIDPHPDFVDGELDVEGDVLVWFDDRRTDAAHAALVNGTVAHHAELDDGDPRAGLHGGVTVIPAALAVGQAAGSIGAELLDAIAYGYAAGVAYGRPLLERIERHRLHPPAMVGCFGAAAAAARLLALDDEATAGAIALAGTLMPLAPFESFTRGAPVKDLYGGYPAFIGVRAAQMAGHGIRGPGGLYRPDPIDLDEVDYVYIKRWPSCRATHAALTALETLLPFDRPVASIHVETYPFAAELSADADSTTPIGAKASIPHAMASLIGEPVADRIEVVAAPNASGRSAGVSVHFEDGTETRAFAPAPRDETHPRAKFRKLVGARADAIEAAVDGLPDARNLDALVAALSPETEVF